MINGWTRTCQGQSKMHKNKRDANTKHRLRQQERIEKKWHEEIPEKIVIEESCTSMERAGKMLEDVLPTTATKQTERWGAGQHNNKNQRNVVPSREWYAILYEPNVDLKIWQVHGRRHQTNTTTKKKQQQPVMCTSTTRCRKRSSTHCGTAKRRTTAYALSRPRTRKTKRRNDVGTSFDGMETNSMWREVLQDALRHDEHEPTIETIESRAQAIDEASANAQDMRTLYTKVMMSIGCPDGVLRTRPRTGGFMGHPVVCKAFGHTFQRPVAE